MFDLSKFRTIQGANSTTFHRPPLDQFLSFPELYAYHAANSPNHPLFVYAEDDGTTKTIYYPQAYRAIRRAAKLASDHYKRAENKYLEQLKKEGADVPVIGILAVADTISFFTLLVGIMHLGLIPFPISARNSAAGVAHLMEKAGITQLFVSPDAITQRLAAHANDFLKEKAAEAEILAMPRFEDLYNDNDAFEEATLFKRGVDDVVFIIHSSGSTAFPKPIKMTQSNFLTSGVAPYYGEVDLCDQVFAMHALPMFHLMGALGIPWSVLSGIVVGCFKPSYPPIAPSPETFIGAIKATNSSVVFSVPTFVETWSRSPEYIEIMKLLRALIFAGAPLSEPVGDQLFAQGVPLVALYGSTEVGVATPMIPEPLKQPLWNYMRLSPHLEVELVKQEDADDLFEPVIIATETSKPNVTNTTVKGRPAYAMSDLLQSHPTLPGYYKVYGRVDDQIMLSTGEKTNPVPLEAMFIKDPYISFAIMFGRGRFQNGVLIQPNEPFDPSDEAKLTEFRNKIWPTVEKINEFAPSHSRIFKEMIITTHPNRPFELTAKATPRRQICINAYAEEIEAVYKAVQDSSQVELPVPVVWTKETTEEFVRAVVTRVMKADLADDDDFFQSGCDSLQQTWLRNTIIHALRSSSSLPVHQIPHNMVYLYPTIRSLSSFVYNFVGGGAHGAHGSPADLKAAEMLALVDKYGAGLARRAGAGGAPPADRAKAIVLTGTTGRLGCHMLAQLLQQADVERVFALNRDAQGSDAALLKRQRAAFAEWGLDVGLLDSPRVALWASDLTKADLGLGAARYEQIRSSVTAILHNAWRVDFNLSLTSFEPLLAGVRHLLDVALQSPLPGGANVLFVSSIASLASPPREPVPEELFADPRVAIGAGYGESKWVAEQICVRAARDAGLRTTSVRVGQLCGDTRVGGWNTKEWVAAIMGAAQALGCMPVKDERVSWLPVDVAGAALLDMLYAPASSPVLHLVHPTPVKWDALFSAAAARLHVPTVPYAEWLDKLDAAAAESKKSPAGATGGQHSTAVTILEFFRTGAVERCALSTDHAVGASRTLREFRPLGEDDLLRSLDYWAQAGVLKL